MRTFLSLSALLIALSAQLAISDVALAKSSKQLIEEGLNLRERGQDQRALQLFQEAYRKTPTAQALAQIALAEQALGRWVDAQLHLSEALQSKEAWIAQRSAPLNRALQAIRDRLARVEVLGAPAGAKVLINGKQIGTLPLSAPIYVTAGSTLIELRAQGHRSSNRTIELKAGAFGRETIELLPLPKPSPPPAVVNKPNPKQRVDPRPAESSPALTANVQPAQKSSLDLWAWAAAAGALGGVIGGVVGVVVRAGHINNYNDDALCLVNGLTRDENCGGRLDSANAAQAGAIGGFAAAGAFAIASGLLFYFDSKAQVALAPGPGEAGLRVHARF